METVISRTFAQHFVDCIILLKKYLRCLMMILQCGGHEAVRDWVTGPAGGQNITHLRCGDGGDNCAAAAPPAIEATLQNKAAAELLSTGVARLAPCQARGSTVTNADTCTAARSYCR